MRVYLPATLPLVAELLSGGALPAPLAAYAVTPVLRAWADESGPSGEEELELVALSEAARASLRLLADGGAPAVRMVLAVEVPDAAVRVEDTSDEAGPGQVGVTSPLQAAWVRAAHVDDRAAAQDVRLAAASVHAADADEQGAEEVVARLDQHDLLWFAAEELPALVAAGA
jgi:hypothetical protein